MSIQMKERILSALIVGLFVFSGLALFAGRVFEEHKEMIKQLGANQKDTVRKIDDINTSMKYEMQLLEIKQREVNARVIEMRSICK